MNQPNPSTSSNKEGNNGNEQLIIIEEKVTNALGEPVIKKYTRGKFLGKGGFAKCYEFTNLETKKITAAKIVPKATLQKSRQRAKLLSEIKIHRSIHHTNVVHFEHVFEDGENVYIMLIINALKYLASNKIIHRDLKLGNLFLSDKM